jgi:hypothetical protein
MPPLLFPLPPLLPLPLPLPLTLPLPPPLLRSLPLPLPLLVVPTPLPLPLPPLPLLLFVPASSPDISGATSLAASSGDAASCPRDQPVVVLEGAPPHATMAPTTKRQLLLVRRQCNFTAAFLRKRDSDQRGCPR